MANFTVQFPKGDSETPGGGGTTGESDVNFYDYDGTLLHSYTKDEFLALDTMPDNPSHEGLVAQGWNWTLEDAKEHVNANPLLDVGQLYVTDNGETRFYLKIEEYLLGTAFSFKILQTVQNDTVIDWGDGSDLETLEATSATLSHTYETRGQYIVRIKSNAGYHYFNSALNETTFLTSLPQAIRKIELGNILPAPLIIDNASNVETITIPNIRFTRSTSETESHALKLGCSKLRFGVLPNQNVESGRKFSMYSATFSNCTYMEHVSLPKNLGSIARYFFSSCYSLSRVIFPKDYSSGIPEYCFNCCYSLKLVSWIDGGGGGIGDRAFCYCKCLRELTLPKNLTAFSRYVFDSSEIQVLHIKFTTKPAASYITDDYSVPKRVYFLVPKGRLEYFKGVWSSRADHIFEEPD